MRFTIQAACGCHTGKVRRQNEDNFFFDGKCLEREHTGLHHPVSIEESLKNGMCFAVFDGLGGEHFGEYASFADFAISSVKTWCSPRMRPSGVELSGSSLTHNGANVGGCGIA